MQINVAEHIGNYQLLKLNKTAFLCSRKVTASCVFKCYDWAIAQRDAGNCVISGFHSQIEKDILHYLLKGSQPIIVVLARGIKQRIEPEFEQALSQNRLLIISPFDKQTKRVTKDTSQTRNRLMIDLADNITVGYISEGGQLEDLLKHVNKEIIQL